MKRSNFYEAAFEAYLQWHGLCYVAVDETRRSMMGDIRVKSLDFIVYGEGGARLLVDVKGRRFPCGPKDRRRRVWESWSTRDDVQGLEQWAEVFGSGFQAVLVFMYHVLPEVDLPEDCEDLWTWHGRRYLLRAVAVNDYRAHMRVRSPKWDTVCLPGPIFRKLVQSVQSYVQQSQPVSQECPF
jgi:hypothetical protein